MPNLKAPPIRPPLSVAEAAYLAGFFDADGSVGVYRKGRGYLLQATANGVHQESIERFTKVFGGWTFLENRSMLPNHKNCWRWTASNAVAKAALTELLPYLVVKRAQVEVALTYPFGRGDSLRAEREALVTRIKDLKWKTA